MKVIIDIPEIPKNDKQRWALANGTHYIEYKAKVKELEDAIAKCEKAEKDFKSRTCKFRSPKNCDFCAFHSDCDEHWKEGEDAPKSQEDKGTKKCPNCGSDLYEYCFMCCYEGKRVKKNESDATA